MKKINVKEVKMHTFLVCPCKSQDFAQSPKNFAQSHYHVTVTFRNSVKTVHRLKMLSNHAILKLVYISQLFKNKLRPILIPFQIP